MNRISFQLKPDDFVSNGQESVDEKADLFFWHFPGIQHGQNWEDKQTDLDVKMDFMMKFRRNSLAEQFYSFRGKRISSFTQQDKYRHDHEQNFIEKLLRISPLDSANTLKLAYSGLCSYAHQLATGGYERSGLVWG